MLSTMKSLKTTKRYRKTLTQEITLYYPSSTEGKTLKRLPENIKTKIKQCTYIYIFGNHKCH